MGDCDTVQAFLDAGGIVAVVTIQWLFFIVLIRSGIKLPSKEPDKT